MPDQRDFLEAIRQAPDDDTPRLIYADWLDDQGDGERAAFIRFQCAAAPVCDHRQSLKHRPPRELLARLGIDLDRVLVPALSHFWRGFLAHIRVPAERSEELFGLREIEPCDGVRIEFNRMRTWWDQPAARRLAQQAISAGLIWSGWGRSTGSPWPSEGSVLPWKNLRMAAPVPAPPPGMFPNLERLAIGSTTPVRALLDASLGRLKELQLVEGWGGFARVFGHPATRTLESLDLTVYDERNRTPLAGLDAPELRSLSIGWAWSASTLADALTRLLAAYRIERLSLATPMPMDGHGLAELAEALPNLRALTIAASFREDARPLAEQAWPMLDELNLKPRLGVIRPAALGVFARLLPRLRTLTVKSNLAGDDYPGLFAGLEGIKSTTLTRLTLDGCPGSVAVRLAKLPACAGLEALRLRADKCTDRALDWSPTVVEALAGSAFGGNLAALVLGHYGTRKTSGAKAVERFGPRCDAYWYRGVPHLT